MSNWIKDVFGDLVNLDRCHAIEVDGNDDDVENDEWFVVAKINWPLDAEGHDGYAWTIFEGTFEECRAFVDKLYKSLHVAGLDS